MSLKQLKSLIKQDLISYDENHISNVNLYNLFFRYLKTPGFKVTFWMRICKFLDQYKYLRFLFYLCRFKYRKLQVKYGIQIGYKLDIKGGFCINHYSGIVIGQSTIIGSNFNIRHNLTIGHVNWKNPVIGDNVACGPGVIIIGNVHIGNNVLIGAGSIVTKDVPDNSLVVGNPGKVIKKIKAEDVRI